MRHVRIGSPFPPGGGRGKIPCIDLEVTGKGACGVSWASCGRRAAGVVPGSAGETDRERSGSSSTRAVIATPWAHLWERGAGGSLSSCKNWARRRWSYGVRRGGTSLALEWAWSRTTAGHRLRTRDGPRSAGTEVEGPQRVIDRTVERVESRTAKGAAFRGRPDQPATRHDEAGDLTADEGNPAAPFTCWGRVSVWCPRPPPVGRTPSGREDGLAAGRAGRLGESRQRADRIAHRRFLVHAGELGEGHCGGIVLSSTRTGRDQGRWQTLPGVAHRESLYTERDCSCC